MTAARWMGAALLAFAAGAAQAQGQSFELVTPEQAAAAQRAERDPAQAPAPPPRTRTALQPSIRVLAPSLGSAPLRSPVRIELAFEAASGAKIDLSSFKVLYGVLRVDLTEVIRKNASVTEKGVVAPAAQVPAGSHRLLLRIRDDQGRTGETELRFAVQE